MIQGFDFDLFYLLYNTYFGKAIILNSTYFVSVALQKLFCRLAGIFSFCDSLFIFCEKQTKKQQQKQQHNNQKQTNKQTKKQQHLFLNSTLTLATAFNRIFYLFPSKCRISKSIRVFDILKTTVFLCQTFLP